MKITDAGIVVCEGGERCAWLGGFCLTEGKEEG